MSFKQRLWTLIGILILGMIFLFGFTPKDSDPRNWIPGINIVKETDPEIIGSYHLRYERLGVIDDPSNKIVKPKDIPCLSVQHITAYWRFNVLSESYGYHWVVRNSFFGKECLTLVKK